MGGFGETTGEQAFNKWLAIAGKKVTNYQYRVMMNAVGVCSIPLFCRISFTDVMKWRSYSPKELTLLASSIPTAVDLLFTRLEAKYDATLVEHALAYITASKQGLSEAELEDILSIDDLVLNSVFAYQLPALRRLPSILWLKAGLPAD